MAIDWDLKETPATVSPRPPIDEEMTHLAVYEFTVLEGPLQYDTVQITRAFRSWSPNRDGDHFVHVWAEAEGIGFVADEEDGHVAWIQYVLDSRAARLPLYDQRGTSRPESPKGRLKDNPFGTIPTGPLLAIEAGPPAKAEPTPPSRFTVAQVPPEVLGEIVEQELLPDDPLVAPGVRPAPVE